MDFRVSSSMPRIHITMKKAIIAVTKSAYATFHEPPWWPCAFLMTFLMMMGRFSLDMSGRLLLGERLEVGERRAVAGLDVAPSELHRGHRRVAAREGEERGADAGHVGVLRLDARLDRGGHRPHDAVR